MSAVTLRWSRPGFIGRHGVAADALDKELDAYRMRHNKTVLQGESFFRFVKTRGGSYKESNYGNGLELPRVSEDTARMPLVTPVPGFNEEITITTYRAGIQVERALPEDQIFAVAQKMMSGLMRSGKLCLEYAMADKMNNLTSTAAAYVGADGVAVASDDHPHERRETGTWSNIESAAALTHASFSTARKNMRKRTDEFGYVMSVFPRKLVVPPELEQKAREIRTAEKVPENALNQPNVWKDTGWEVTVYDYLTDTNGWMLWGDMPADSCGLMIAQSEPSAIAPMTGRDTSTDVIWGRRLRMRFGMGVLTEKNLQYNAGA